MAPPTYAQTSTATPSSVYVQRFLAALAGSGLAGWGSSAPQMGLVQGNADALAAESTMRATVAQTLSPAGAVALDEAAGQGPIWTKLWAERFGLTPEPATPAYWSVPFQVAPSAAPLLVDGSFPIVIQASDGRFFSLTFSTPVLSYPPTLFNAASSYQGSLVLVARALGSAGSNAITGARIVTAPAGLTLGPGSPVGLISGDDAETPAALVARCLGRWGTLGIAPIRSTFDYIVPTYAPAVKRWRINDANPLGPGTTLITCASATGASTHDDMQPLIDYFASLQGAVVGYGRITVVAATTDAHTLAVTLKDAGVNPNLVAQATAALQLFLGALPVGPYTLNVDALLAVAGGASFTTPAGALIPIEFATPTGFTSISVPGLGFGGAAGVPSILLDGSPLTPSTVITIGGGHLFGATLTVGTA